MSATTVSAQDAWSRLSASTLWSMGGVARVRLLDDAGLTALRAEVEIYDLAVITCVQDDAAPSYRAGTLVAYPHRWDEPVDHIRATPEDGAVPVPLAPGESVVLLGGVVTHRLPPSGSGRVRVVAPLCFRLAPGETPADQRSYRPDRRAA